MIVYDCEIVKGILGKDEKPREGIEYCEGWRDFPNMGLSCIGAFDYVTRQYRVFCQDNFYAFQELADTADIVVGFNSIGFDNKLCAANDIYISDSKSYDILVEVWKGAGLGPLFEYPSHIGFGLDAICEANLGLKKSGHGALAPVLWQQGKIGEVIDYCLNDVRMTVNLLNFIIAGGRIRDPRDIKNLLTIKRP